MRVIILSLLDPVSCPAVFGFVSTPCRILDNIRALDADTEPVGAWSRDIWERQQVLNGTSQIRNLGSCIMPRARALSSYIRMSFRADTVTSWLERCDVIMPLTAALLPGTRCNARH